MVVKLKQRESKPTKAKETPRRYFYGTGRRKTSIARVRLYEKGTGIITLNHESSPGDPVYLSPLKLVGEENKWDVSAVVEGGGIQGQKEAIRLGVARALVEMNGEWRQSLKKAGYLRRDPREKERKKYGLKRARRAPQWAKR